MLTERRTRRNNGPNNFGHGFVVSNDNTQVYCTLGEMAHNFARIINRLTFLLKLSMSDK